MTVVGNATIVLIVAFRVLISAKTLTELWDVPSAPENRSYRSLA
jgi:hypothetical protein